MNFTYRGWDCHINSCAMTTDEQWEGLHPSYDGAVDSCSRYWYCHASSEDELKKAIDDWIEENEDSDHSPS